jgi:hypothetical protein
MEESRAATRQLSNIVQHLAQIPPVLDLNSTSQEDVFSDSLLDPGLSKQELTGGGDADVCQDISMTSKKDGDENVRAVDNVPVTDLKEAAVPVCIKSPQTDEELPKDETATETNEENLPTSQVTEVLVEGSETTDDVENATVPHTEEPIVAAHTEEISEIDNARIEMGNGYGESDDVLGAQRPHSWKARGRCMPAAQPERGRPPVCAAPEGFGRGGVNRPYENQGPHHPWVYNSYDNSGPHHPGVNSPYGNLWSHGNLGGPPYPEVNNPYDLGPRHQWVNNNPYGNLGSRDPGVGNPGLGPHHQWVNNQGVNTGVQHNLAVSGSDVDWRLRHPWGWKHRGRKRKGWRGRHF